MSEKMKWLEKYAPLGICVVNQVRSYLVGLVIATVYSMWFIIRYISARNALFEYVRGERKLIEGAVIQDFGILTENLFWGFVIMMIVTILTAVFFYFYHYDGSKMIYLMKRLPDKGELWRRCVTLPVIGTVILIAWLGIVYLMYYAIYLFCTPAQCLPL